MLHFVPYYILHMLVYALAHARLGWRTGLRYLWRAQQEPVFLLFTFIRASVIVALGVPVSKCIIYFFLGGGLAMLSLSRSSHPLPLFFLAFSFCPKFGFQVTRKDPVSSPSTQAQQRCSSPKTQGDKDIFAEDLAYAFPHVLMLLVGWACLITGTRAMIALFPDNGNLCIAYGVNIAWASLVLSGFWVPVSQILGDRWKFLRPPLFLPSCGKVFRLVLDAKRMALTTQRPLHFPFALKQSFELPHLSVVFDAIMRAAQGAPLVQCAPYPETESSAALSAGSGSLRGA
jgi:hypothetical protein